MIKKTYKINSSKATEVVNELFDICMKMQIDLDDGHDKQFIELIKNLSSLVDKLGQSDIDQMMADLKKLVSNSTEGDLEDEGTAK